MEIRDNKKVCIFAPLCPRIDKRTAQRLFDVMNNEKRELALDLANVTDCTIEFIEELKAFAKSNKIGVFNIPSDIFVLFNVMKLDRYVNIFVTESDFEENSRQIINRRFSVI